jgi:hypothetical protein
MCRFQDESYVVTDVETAITQKFPLYSERTEEWRQGLPNLVSSKKLMIMALPGGKGEPLSFSVLLCPYFGVDVHAYLLIYDLYLGPPVLLMTYHIKFVPEIGNLIAFKKVYHQ